MMDFARRQCPSWTVPLYFCLLLTGIQVLKTLQFVRERASSQQQAYLHEAPRPVEGGLPTLGNITATTTPSSSSIAALYLRYDWTNLERLSTLAHQFSAHQSNCDLPLANFRYRNRFGLGSDLHVYSQALCNTLERNRYRVFTSAPWIWRDDSSCQDDASAMTCYFPQSELRCPGDRAGVVQHRHLMTNLTRGRGRLRSECQSLMSRYGVSHVRAASSEFLFTRVSSTIQHEAERQLNAVFRGRQVLPQNLITVHIRWGDKADEMELVPIHDYVKAVERILEESGPVHVADVHILLCTEDPRAVQEFRGAANRDWNLYVDQYFHDMLPHRRRTYNGGPLMSQEMTGRPGLVALGSLLVAMQANNFVLTTASNWSRLMNELRLNIVNPRCHNCTRMIDLKAGEW
jgi:hypothetical protein